VRLGFKVWLDNNGKAFGEGPYHLLLRIEKAGSLRKAAMEMEMSYRKAWLIIQRCEERLGIELIARRAGGIAGGGSSLTQPGKEFVGRYGKFREEAGKALESLYKKYFP
jgi:molybdate transport system regulatory protein